MAKFNVGEAYVQVLPSFDQFHNKVRAQVARIRDIEIDVTPNMDSFRERVSAGTRGLRAVEIDVTPNMRGFRERVAAATRGIGGIEIPVTADTRRASDDVARFTQNMSNSVSRHAQLMQLAVSAAMLGISAAVGPALAVVAALPAALLGIIAPAGAVAIGFSGMGDAVEALAAAEQAATGTAKEQAKAHDELLRAMAKLSPEAQSFARTWQSELIPAMRTVRQMVQSELFPGLELSLHNIQPLIPVIADGLADTAEIVGDLAAQGAAMMASGPWRADFAQIMESNNQAFRAWGQAGLSLLDVLRNLAVTAGPITERFAAFAQQASAAFAAFIEGKRATGELGLLFQQMGDALSAIGTVLAQTAVGLYNLATALAPAGMLFLSTTAGLIQLIGALAQANPLLAQVAVVALGLAPAFRFAATAATALGGAFAFLYTGGLAAKLQTAALAAGVFTERLTGSADAGERVATSGSKLGTVLTRIGQTLPVLGAAVIALTFAWENQRQKIDDAAAAILQGGQAAQTAINDITRAEQEYQAALADMDPVLRAINNAATAFAEAIGLGSPKLADVTAKVEELRKAMDPLTRAQSDARIAQNDYLTALEQSRGGTDDVIAAQKRFQAATEEVKNQQKLLEDALKNTTEAIREQSDAIISSVDADISYRDSLQDLIDSVKEHGTVTDLNTEAGRRNVEAFSRSVQAAQALDDALVATGASTAEVTAAHEQHVAALRAEAAQLGLTGPEIDKLIGAYERAKPSVDGLSAAIRGVPQPAPITFSANAQPAVTEAERARLAIIGVPPDHTTFFTGDAADAWAKAAETQARVGAVPGDHVTFFTADAADAWAKASQTTVNVNAIPDRNVQLHAQDHASPIANIVRAAVNILAPPPIKIVASDQSTSVIRGIINWLNAIPRVITTVVRTVTGGAGGMIATPSMIAMATGGVLPMARGDELERMRPMSGRTARMVPPRTYRLIGDRITDDEAFIPINNSAWSQAILAQTAARMGFALLPMAHGGGLTWGMNWRDPRLWEWIRSLIVGLRRGGGGGGGQPGPVGMAPVQRVTWSDPTRLVGFGGGAARITSATHTTPRSLTYGSVIPSPTGTPRPAGGQPGPVVIRFDRGGTPIEQLFAEVLRKVCRVQGGNVQLVFGR